MTVTIMVGAGRSLGAVTTPTGSRMTRDTVGVIGGGGGVTGHVTGLMTGTGTGIGHVTGHTAGHVTTIIADGIGRGGTQDRITTSDTLTDTGEGILTPDQGHAQGELQAS